MKDTNNDHYFVVMTNYSKVHKHIPFSKEFYFFISHLSKHGNRLNTLMREWLNIAFLTNNT